MLSNAGVVDSQTVSILSASVNTVSTKNKTEITVKTMLSKVKYTSIAFVLCADVSGQSSTIIMVDRT